MTLWNNRKKSFDYKSMRWSWHELTISTITDLRRHGAWNTACTFHRFLWIVQWLSHLFWKKSYQKAQRVILLWFPRKSEKEKFVLFERLLTLWFSDRETYNWRPTLQLQIRAPDFNIFLAVKPITCLQLIMTDGNYAVDYKVIYDTHITPTEFNIQFQKTGKGETVLTVAFPFGSSGRRHRLRYLRLVFLPISCMIPFPRVFRPNIFFNFFVDFVSFNDQRTAEFALWAVVLLPRANVSMVFDEHVWIPMISTSRTRWSSGLSFLHISGCFKHLQSRKRSLN